MAALRDGGVVWLFLVDDLHVEFRTTGLVRAWLSSLARELIRENDVFALRATGPSRSSVGLLGGMPDLENAVRQLAGAGLKAGDLQAVSGTAALDEVTYRARVALRTAVEFLATVPQHDPRPRVMLYVGKGFDVGDAILEDTDRLVDAAQRLDVTVIALDVGVLPGAQAPVPYLADAQRMREIEARRRSLDRLALPTRGFVIADADSLKTPPSASDPDSLAMRIRGAAIRDPGYGISDPGYGISDPGSGMRDPGCGIRDAGSGISD